MQPVCTQCQSIMERYRQSVGRTQANHSKYKFFILCNTYTVIIIWHNQFKLVKPSGYPLTGGIILTLF